MAVAHGRKKKTASEVYFDWMCNLVASKEEIKRYKCILAYLYDRKFVWLDNQPMDECRAEDGIGLRYRYGYEEGIDDEYIREKIDFKECSILEMMVALSVRCEESIMSNPIYGDRTGQWFWKMMSSIGIDRLDNETFDEDIADEYVDRCLNRDISKEGEGGWFYVPGCTVDMRKTDIWYQLMAYLRTIDD